ncbi:MAG: tetratricopeptide repeat protein [Leptolyngbya sp. SIOISBB]|nr:tetratricopeptide repeat protein [Leptolyngbya sp. SIOISBB]
MIYGLIGPLSLLGTAFWIWMLYDCLKNGSRGGFTWVWILLFLNIIGAVLYFVIVWMPNHPNAFGNLPWVKQGKLQDALWQAEAQAKNIGNAYQYQKLGDVHYQLGNLEAAGQAYETALEKDPENIQTLWGISSVEAEQKKMTMARDHLAKLIALKPDFSYGEASLAYGQVLYQLEERDRAEAHLQEHVKSWSHPQAYLMLAQIQQEAGDVAKARDTLETMIIKIKSSTQFQYRKNKHYVQQGERLLSQLSPS